MTEKRAILVFPTEVRGILGINPSFWPSQRGLARFGLYSLVKQWFKNLSVLIPLENGGGQHAPVLTRPIFGWGQHMLFLNILIINKLVWFTC